MGVDLRVINLSLRDILCNSIYKVKKFDAKFREVGRKVSLSKKKKGVLNNKRVQGMNFSEVWNFGEVNTANFLFIGINKNNMVNY
jgi:hypothetical protein